MIPKLVISLFSSVCSTPDSSFDSSVDSSIDRASSFELRASNFGFRVFPNGFLSYFWNSFPAWFPSCPPKAICTLFSRTRWVVHDSKLVISLFSSVGRALYIELSMHLDYQDVHHVHDSHWLSNLPILEASTAPVV